jgi:hypothetical protein
MKIQFKQLVRKWHDNIHENIRKYTLETETTRNYEIKLSSFGKNPCFGLPKQLIYQKNQIRFDFKK